MLDFATPYWVYMLMCFLVFPNDREVKLEQRRLKEKMKEFNKKDAKFYGNMFAKLTVSVSNPVLILYL